MTAAEIVQELKALASESIKKLLLKHGVKEPVLGVKTYPRRSGTDIDGSARPMAIFVGMIW